MYFDVIFIFLLQKKIQKEISERAMRNKVA